MEVGNRYCSICGKQKEKKYISYANINVFIECECERSARLKKEKADIEFALKSAARLRNKSSHLTPVGQKASFDTMVVDNENEKGAKGCKYILNCLLKEQQEQTKNSIVLQGNRGSGTHVNPPLVLIVRRPDAHPRPRSCRAAGQSAVPDGCRVPVCSRT